MTRLLSPDDHCIGIDLPRRKYDGTTLDVSNSHDVYLLRKAGYTVADTGGAPVRRSGYRCPRDSFRSFFKTCGRCGGECERAE